ncbi:unnamed protein product [Cyprideis torosa]|uniref:Uncharacterized protein n=1 Tax=Cyprideis torosa TaxID=163714 RepID=A0A7R8WLH4_9CRUS|nr:unnamed protein product [Cyprideis torosa]CAG0898088.1 unnamed protein product [Cyprideis torosa]
MEREIREPKDKQSANYRWHLPKIQALRLATSNRASIHRTMCRQELSRQEMRIKVDLGLPYCALKLPNLPDLGINTDLQEVQFSITRSASSTF